MTKKMSDNVDGLNVETYGATFSGTIDIELPDARYMAFDEELLVVAKVRVKMPRLKEARNGEITRINVLGLKEMALVRSDDLKGHLCRTLGLDMPEVQFPLSLPGTGSDLQEPATPDLHEATLGLGETLPPFAAEDPAVRIEADRKFAAAAAEHTEGPKSVPWRLEDEDDEGMISDGPAEVEVVGQIAPKKSDRSLAGFLQSTS